MEPIQRLTQYRRDWKEKPRSRGMGPVASASAALLLLAAVAPKVWGAAALEVRVNKCCPLHQQLISQTACGDYDYEKYKVVREARAAPRLPWWVSADLRVVSPSGEVVPASTVRWVASPDASAPCPASSRSLLLQSFDEFNVTHDGRMLLYDEDEDEEERLQLRAGAFCLDRLKDKDGRLVALACACDAASAWCWRRCCPTGYRLQVHDRDRLHQNATCHLDSGDGDDVGTARWQPEAPLGVGGRRLRRWKVYGFPQCSEGEHVAATQAAQRWRLQEDWHAWVEGEPASLPLERYCADERLLLYCSARPVAWTPNRRHALLYGVLFGLGAMFLLATVLVYSCLPGLLARLHARTVVAHSSSLLTAYVALAALQSRPDMPLPACSAMAFVVQFSSLSAFFWLNVMCIDISWAFSGLRPPQGSAAERDRKKFWWYSGYAWGGTAAIVAATAAVEYAPSVASGATLKPDFGAVRCWFRGRQAALLFFYGPVSGLLLANLALFAFTAVRIVTVRKETQILDQSDGRQRRSGNYHKERQRLSLYSKLFGLMGLTWVTEIVSWAVGGPDYYWYLTDLVNLLRAAFLFYLFCCKRSVLRLLRMSLPSCCPWALPPLEGHGGSGSGISKTKADRSTSYSSAGDRSRSLTSQRTTSFKLTEHQLAQLTAQHQQQVENPVPTIPEEGHTNPEGPSTAPTTEPAAAVPVRNRPRE